MNEQLLKMNGLSVGILDALSFESHLGIPLKKNLHYFDLVELKRELNREVGYKGVQLVTISRPTAYGEYAPYHFVDTEQEFQTLVKSLRP